MSISTDLSVSPSDVVLVQGRRGKVMTDCTAAKKLKDLSSMIGNVLAPRNPRGPASRATAPISHLLTFCKEECSPAKVFGCPRGELPAVPEDVEGKVGCRRFTASSPGVVSGDSTKTP